MTVKPILRYIAACLVLLVLAGVLAVGWLAGTTSGTGWLVQTLSRHSDGRFAVASVTGRLAGELELRELKLRLPRQQLDLQQLRLSWKPLLLLTGTVGISELQLQGVRIVDSTPPPPQPHPLDLTWPHPPRVAELFDVVIGRLTVADLVYRHLNDPSLQVQQLICSLTWQGQQLSINQLSLVSSHGRLAGSLGAGFQRPSLTLNLTVTPTTPISGLESFSLQARLLPAKKPEQLAGPVTLAGSLNQQGRRQRLELSGQVGLAPRRVNLRGVKLATSAVKGYLTADGSVALAQPEPLLNLQLQAFGLDLAPLLKQTTDLNGSLTLKGTPRSYTGRLAINNRVKGWQTVRLEGDYHGNDQGVTLPRLNGALLDGSLQGNLLLEWRDGLAVRTGLRARGLNPGRVASQWEGQINLDLSADLAWPQQAPARGTLDGTLLQSRLQGQALTGSVSAGLAGESVTIAHLDLQGNGFSLHAAGDLERRLALQARISDLSRLVPQATGSLTAEGWLAYAAGQPSGAMLIQGRRLAGQGVELGSGHIDARLGQGKQQPLQLKANLSRLSYGRFSSDSIDLEGSGTTARHQLSLRMAADGARAQLSLEGHYADGGWSGLITALSGGDLHGPWGMTAPARLSVSSRSLRLSTLEIASASERLTLEADLTGPPWAGPVRCDWSGLKLSRGSEWLRDVQLSGTSSGSLRGRLLAGERLDLTAKASLQGSITVEGRSLTVQSARLDASGGSQGVNGQLEVDLTGGGGVKASLASPKPLRLALPEQGTFSLELVALDPLLLQPWLPAGTRLEGRINGRATGAMLPEQRFSLEGNVALGQGRLAWESAQGQMSVALNSLAASWGWRGDSLQGSLNVELAKAGQARGTFRLPLAAHLPLAFSPRGSVQASLKGQVQEQGLLTAMFPGLVQETKGELDLNLSVGGQWAQPVMAGTLQMTRAQAYLPSAGIHLRDVQFTARLEKDLIRVDSLRATSGSGRLEGTLLLQLKGWQLVGFRGSINGDDFQTVYFPELQVQSSPWLTFEGTPRRLAVRGEVKLPQFRITGPPSKAPVAPSSDVILEGREAAPSAKSPLELDVQVRLVLGDRVVVKMEGIDAQLGGSMELSLASLNRITSRGEIRVVKGRYQTYGVNLEIVRGRLFYAGGPVNQPTLDILALRTVGDVRSGVTVSGSLLAPVVKLYSEPSMPDVDILAYIVLGHPLGQSSGEQAGLLTQAAGVLLSTGQSAALQDQIKSRLGLSTLELQSTAKDTSHMGYKPIQMSPTGTAPTTQTGGISQTMLTVGKYLTPSLYVSYGRSLFTGANLFMLRYDLFKRWQIETQTGNESGADLYYKIEFK